MSPVDKNVILRGLPPNALLHPKEKNRPGMSGCGFHCAARRPNRPPLPRGGRGVICVNSGQAAAAVASPEVAPEQTGLMANSAAWHL
jgi:hypothetical protein